MQTLKKVFHLPNPIIEVALAHSKQYFWTLQFITSGLLRRIILGVLYQIIRHVTIRQIGIPTPSYIQQNLGVPP